MCFLDHDYDWYASVSERSTVTLEKPTQCQECRRMMQSGETAHHVYMQEAEECVDCEHGDCECGWNDEAGTFRCCKCPEPSVGNTFDYDCCVECDKFLQAVEAAEIDAGCAISDALPPLTEMMEAIMNGDMDDAKRYFKKAVAMWPELKASGYLGRLWRDMFGRG